MIRYQDIHNAYIGSLIAIKDNYDNICFTRGLECREIENFSFKILNPLPTPIRTADVKRNKIIEEYTEKEVALYNSCTNSVDDFAKASKFWRKIANPDGTINSAYGYLIWKNKSMGNSKYQNDEFITPWEWAKKSLKNDKETRQAFIKFSLPEHQWLKNKDQTCTMHGNFLIRNNKLNLSIVMRSNDCKKGLVFDLPWFISLMYKMRSELLDVYPKLKIGTYTHFVHSFHMYERDLNDVKKMIGV